MRQLEPLEGVAGLRLLPDDVQHRVDQLSPLGVVALGPVVARACLAEDEVVGPEELAERTRAHRVHGSGLEVHEDGARYVPAAGGLVKVAVDALQLEVGVAMVRAGGVNAVLVGDDFPELRPDLLTRAIVSCYRTIVLSSKRNHELDMKRRKYGGDGGGTANGKERGERGERVTVVKSIALSAGSAWAGNARAQYEARHDRTR